MLRYLVLWQLPLRVTGGCDVDTAARRIESLLVPHGGSLALDERLAGRLIGRRLTVWRAGPLHQLGDTVELAGELRDGAPGSVVEGVLRYRLRTRVQFIGCLALALAIALVGVLRHFAEAGGGDLIGIGAGVGAAIVLWMYSSRQMVAHQVRFIRERLEQALAGGDADRRASA